jgi:shikimate kinase
MEKLFFVGIKHSGKTTFAKRMAPRFGYEFSDADNLILDYLD